MFKLIYCETAGQTNYNISKILYELIIESMSNTVIVGEDGPEFESFKQSLWQGINKYSFPYIDHTSDYANISPLVCSNIITKINEPENIILFNISKLDQDHIDSIKGIKNVYIFVNTKEILASVQSLLTANNLEFQQEEKTRSYEERPKYDDRQKYDRDKRSGYGSNNRTNQRFGQDSSKYSGYKSSSYNKNVASNSYNSQNKNMNTKSGYSSEYSKPGNKTIMVIKPFVINSRNHFKLLEDIESKGFVITYIGRKKYDKELWEQIYIQHKDEPFYNKMCTYLSENHVYICMVEKQNAIEDLRAIIGNTDPSKAEPNTLRRKYGSNLDDNGIHASSSLEEYNRERNIFFSSVKYGSR